jgi:GNAT superfamily N-acetyltransferase
MPLETIWVLFKCIGAHRENYSPEAFWQFTPDTDKVVKRFDEGPQWWRKLMMRSSGPFRCPPSRKDCTFADIDGRLAPEAQGRGIGHKLMDAVNEFADEERS